MSSIDNRIVQMQFENSQFEKGVQQSLKTIDELNKKLEFKEAEKSIASLQKAGDSFSLAKMGNAVDSISDKFSALGIIGKRVLENLADTAYNKITSTVKALSVDQISAGWSKYADKTKAVQQIMAATHLDIESVNHELERLNWFSDETSYSFTDMVSNIGKFTSMNVPLDKSVTAMQGISTWAALSGAGVQEASRAMYNLSQAMGLGSLKMQDWKSIALANMATSEFKQTAIDTATALGKLKKGQVTLENFESTLSKGWFDKDVMMSVFEQYGDFATQAYELAIKEGISAAEAMDRLSDGTKSLGERAFRAAQEAITFGQAIEATKDAVSSGWMNIFEQIFGNYEQAKVLWTDLANYMWDIFASPLSEIGDIFKLWNEGVDEEDHAILGSRADMLEGIYDIFVSIKGIIYAVRDAFSQIFPPLSLENLQNASLAVKEFGANLKRILTWREDIIGTFEEMTDEEYEMAKAAKEAERIKELKKLFSGDLKIGDTGDKVKELQKLLIQLGYDGVGAVDGVFGPKTQAAVKEFQEKTGLAVTGVFNEKTFLAAASWVDALRAAFSKPLEFGARGDEVKQVQEKLTELGFLDDTIDGILGKKTKKAIEDYQNAKGLEVTGIVDAATFDSMFPEDVLSRTKEYTTESLWFGQALTNIQGIVKGVSAAFDIFLQVLGFAGRIIGHILTLASPLINAILSVGAAIGESIASFDEWLKTPGNLDGAFEAIKGFFEPIGDWAKQAGEDIKKFFGLVEAPEDMMTFPKLWNNIKTSVKNSGVFKKVSAAIWNFRMRLSRLSPQLKASWKAFRESLGEKFNAFLGGIPDKITAVTDAIGTFITDGINLITSWLPTIPGAIDKITAFFNALTDPGDAATGRAPGFLYKVKQGFEDVIDFLFGKGDIEKGKAPGILTKLWKIIVGDYAGAGLTEEQQAELIGKIEEVKTFLRRIGEAISFILTGELPKENALSEDAQKSIMEFRLNVIRLFEIIGLLVSGTPLGGEDTSLDSQTKSNILQFRDTVIGIFNAIGDFFSSIVDTVNTFFSGEIDFSSIEGIRKTFEGVWNNIVGFFGSVGEGAGNAAKTAGSIAIGVIALPFIGISTIVSTVSSYAQSLLTTDFSGFTDEVANRLIGVRAWLETAFSVISALFTGKYEGLDDETRRKISEFRGKIVPIFEGIGNFFNNTWGFIQDIWTGITTNNWETENGKKIKGAFETVKSFFDQVGEGISILFTGKGNEDLLDPNTVSTLKQFNGYLTTIKAGVANFFDGAWGFAQDIWTGITTNDWTGFKDRISSAFENVKKFFGNVGKILKAFFLNDYKGLDLETGIKVLGAKVWIKDKLKVVGEFLANLPSLVKEWVDEILKSAGPVGEQVANVFDGISSFFTGVWGTISDVWTGITTNDWTGFKDRISNAFNNVKKFFGNVGKILKAFFLNDYKGLDLETGIKVLGAKVWIKDKLKVVGDFLAKIPSLVKEWVDEILNNAGPVGKQVASAFDGISSFFTGVWGTISDVWTGITTNDWTGFKDRITNAFENVKTFFANIGKIIAAFFTDDIDSLELDADVKEWVIGAKAKIKEILDSITEFFQNLPEKFKGWGEDLQKNFGPLGGFFNTIFNAIGSVINFIIKHPVLSTALLGLFVLIRFIGSATGLFFRLSDALWAMQGGNLSLTKAIRHISVSLALMAGSLYVLGHMMTKEELDQAFDKIVEIFKWFAGFMTGSGVFGIVKSFIGKKFNDETMANSLGNLASVVKDIGIGVALLTASLYVLDKFLPNETFMVALEKLKNVLSAVSGFMIGLGVLNGITLGKAYGNMVIKGIGEIALVIAAIVASVAVFALINSLDPNVLQKSIDQIKRIIYMVMGLVAVVGAATWFANLNAKVTQPLLKGFGALAALVGVMGVLVIAFAALNYLGIDIQKGLDKLWQIFGMIAALVLVIAVIKSIYNIFNTASTASDGLKAEGAKKGGIFSGILKIAGAIGTIVIASGGLMWVFGLLDGVDGIALKERIDKGGAVLNSIKEAVSPLKDDATTVAEICGMLAVGAILGQEPSIGWGMIAGVGKLILAIGLIELAVGGVSYGLGLLDDALGNTLKEKIDKGGDVLESIGTALSDTLLSPVTSLKNHIDEITKSLTDFADAVTGLTTGDTFDQDKEAAKSLATELANFFLELSGPEYVPDDKPLTEYNQQIDTILKNIGTLGENIGTFKTNVQGIADTSISADTDAAISVAETISEFLKRLQAQNKEIEANKSAIELWFTGKDTTINTVLGNIANFGGVIGQAGSDISGIGADGSTFKKDVGAAINAVSSVMQFIKTDLDPEKMKIPDSYSEEYFEVIGNFQNAIELLRAFFFEIEEFNSVIQAEEVDLSSTESLSNILSNLANVFSQENGIKASTQAFIFDLDPTAVISAIQSFSTQINEAAGNAVTEIQGNLNTFAQSTISLAGGLNGAGTDVLGQLVSGFSSSVDTSPVDTAIGEILSVVNGYKGDFESSGENFSQGLANGIKNNVDAVIKAARTVANMALTTLNSALQEQSPSRATAESGKYFSQGFAIGITEDEAVAKLAAKQMAKGALDEVTNETASFSDKALGMFGGLKSDLNKIYSGANLATMFFGGKKTTDIEKTQNKVLGNAKSGLQSLLGGTAIGGIVGSALSSFTSGVQGWLNGSSSGGITDWLFGGVKTGLQNVFGGFSTGGLLTTALGLNDLANPEEALKSLAAQAGYTDEELGWLTNGFFGLGNAAYYVSASLPAITKELKKGDWDDDQVKAMQQHLMDLGYDLSKFGADGKFGDETLAALTKFEKDFGLEADGILSTIEAKQLELEAKKAGGGTTVSFTGGETSSEDTAAASQTATDMVAAFKSHGNEFYGAGGYFTLGLAGGASKYLNTAVNAAAAVAAAMLAKVREVFNSASPSKETAKYGMWFDQGLAVGVRDYANEATTSSEDVANAMLKTTSGTLSNLSAILAGDIDDTPTISPVVDLTNARAAAASIGGMFGAQSVPIYSRNLAYNASNPGVASRFNTAGRFDSAGASSSDSANLASSIDTLNSRMSSLEFAIKNMKVVTETGAIIGQIASGMDDKLGEFARMHERGG